MAALAAVFGFVACSNDDDGPSKVAVFEDITNIYTATFYSNDTYEVVGDFREAGLGKKTVEKGTYKGKPEGEGKVTLTPKKVAKVEGNKISLVAASSSDKPYDVDVDSNGKCYIWIWDVPFTFTRK